MPMYHYRCRNCNYEYEVQQRISENALTDCSNCQTAGLERVISASGGFILKGTGFYNTDYKNAPAAKSTSPATNSDATKTDSTKNDSAKTASTKNESTKSEATPSNAATPPPTPPATST